MKRTQMIMLTLLLSFAVTSSACAGDRAVNGLLIGAGSGAILGQVAGQNTESVLIGTAIGGVVGYAIGSDLERSHYRTHATPPYRKPMPVYGPAPRNWDHRWSPPPRQIRDRHDWRRDDWRRGYDDCKKVVSYRKDRGHVTKVVKTVCERPRYDRYHRDDNRRRYR